MTGENSRTLAAKTVAGLLANQGTLTSHLSAHKHVPDYALLQETCYGVCRWYPQLQWQLGQLLQKPLKSRDFDLHALMLVGIYQLRSLDLPDYAVINECVSATAKLGKGWARGLVNGVLRNYQRRQGELEDRLTACPPAVRLAHPNWLIDQLQGDWPEQWQQVLDHNNVRPPMTLRVNRLRGSREDYLGRLAEVGMAASPGLLAESAIYLQQPVAVSALPDFSNGLVSVQDEASQVIPPLLDLAPGQRLLDACAAPGGKTCHVLESEPSLESCLALDSDSTRLERLTENLDRLQLQCMVSQGDAADPQGWWDGQLFDRILLDAPCSATGVIRRHPDIKLLLSPDDVAGLHSRQVGLLSSLWHCLRPGGLLLYTTCSVLHAENEASIEAFLHQAGDAKTERIDADWGVECAHGRQLLTSDRNGPDGFYYARLRKVTQT